MTQTQYQENKRKISISSIASTHIWVFKISIIIWRNNRFRIYMDINKNYYYNFFTPSRFLPKLRLDSHNIMVYPEYSLESKIFYTVQTTILELYCIWFLINLNTFVDFFNHQTIVLHCIFNYMIESWRIKKVNL